MFCFIFHCLGSSSSLVPRMGVVGGEKYLSRKRWVQIYIPRGVKVMGFIRAFLHLKSVRRQVSMSILCFFMSYKKKHWLPLFLVVFSRMFTYSTALKNKDFVSLQSQEHVCLQPWNIKTESPSGAKGWHIYCPF